MKFWKRSVVSTVPNEWNICVQQMNCGIVMPYTVHERVAKPGLVSPFLASLNHPIFLICRNEPNGEMIRFTKTRLAIGGQSFLKFAIEEASQDIKSKLVIFPSLFYS